MDTEVELAIFDDVHHIVWSTTDRDECVEKIVEYIDDRIWIVHNVSMDKCRWCRVKFTGKDSTMHVMSCRNYTGPLTHGLREIALPNPTFGGIDYICTCGRHVRIGGMNPSSDVPVCPDAEIDFR